MLSGGKAGLVSVDVLRKEQEENRRRDKNNQPLEGWLSYSLLRHINFIAVDGRTHRTFISSTCTSPMHTSNAHRCLWSYL